MFRGAGFLFILLPGAMLWFIIVWYTHIHSFGWRESGGWFALGRLIGFGGNILLGSNGVHLSHGAEIYLMVCTTAVILFFYIFREFRNQSLTVKLKIMLTWLIVDTTFAKLGLYMTFFPRP
jgi:hypothetical protein